MEEAGTLRGAADEPHIGEVLGCQGGMNNLEIEGVTVGHHQHEPAGGHASQRGGRIEQMHGADVCWHGGGKSLEAGIDPGDVEGQRRQRQNQCPADMTGAEKVKRATVAGKGLDDGAVGANLH